MKRLFIFIHLFSLTAMFVSCDLEPEYRFPEELVIRLEQPQTTKVTLLNPTSLVSSERLWKWEDGDSPSVLYVQNGAEIASKVVSADIFSDDPSKIKIKVGQLPSGASLRGVSFGNTGAYGKTCRHDEDIPTSMVYAKATFTTVGDAVFMPDLTLKHQCSYLLIVPDPVIMTGAKEGMQPTAFIVKGKGLKGGSEVQTIEKSFKSGDEIVAKWLAVSNAATDVTVHVKAGGKLYEMASFPDVGKGNCILYYVRNTSIGTEY